MRQVGGVGWGQLCKARVLICILGTQLGRLVLHWTVGFPLIVDCRCRHCEHCIILLTCYNDFHTVIQPAVPVCRDSFSSPGLLLLKQHNLLVFLKHRCFATCSVDRVGIQLGLCNGLKVAAIHKGRRPAECGVGALLQWVLGRHRSGILRHRVVCGIHLWPGMAVVC